MINDYQKQALVWDWDSYDESSEYEFWREYAGKYGSNVLIPMCAHGKIGAYIAEKGFYVTAFDITPEMITEGKRRYGSVARLELVTADLLNLNLNRNDYDFAFLAGNGDLHLLQTVPDVEKAFHSISRHLRAGGCLVLELTLPADESWSYPKQVFHPRVPGYADKKVWKENEGSYDADEKKHRITQTVYIEDENGIEQFTQNVCLQYYERAEILGILENCGFYVQREYGGRKFEPWESGNLSLIIEAIK